MGSTKMEKEGILKVQDRELWSGSGDGREDCIRVGNNGVWRDSGGADKVYFLDDVKLLSCLNQGWGC